jgi:hypothetical protein
MLISEFLDDKSNSLAGPKAFDVERCAIDDLNAADSS